jgi:hypothetical protein
VWPLMPWPLTDELGIVPSLRDSPHNPILPGTTVPGYRLFRPCGTASVAVSNPLAQPERIAMRPDNSTAGAECPLVGSKDKGRDCSRPLWFD